MLVYFLFPETKGRTLEEIAEIFDGKPLTSTAGLDEKKDREDEVLEDEEKMEAVVQVK